MSERTAYRTSSLRRRTELAVDAVEDAVDEAARLPRAELLGDLDRLVDDHLGRRFRAPAKLVHREAEDVAVHDGHAIEVPVLGVAGDDVVDLRPRSRGAPDDALGELARVRVERVLRPELGRVGSGIGLALQV